MLLPLNIINHIRKDTLMKKNKRVKEENNCKLIDDPSLTSQSNTEKVDSNGFVEALQCSHFIPVSSSLLLLAELFSVHRHQVGCPSHRVKHEGIETSAGGQTPAQLYPTAVS